MGGLGCLAACCSPSGSCLDPSCSPSSCLAARRRPPGGFERGGLLGRLAAPAPRCPGDGGREPPLWPEPERQAGGEGERGGQVSGRGKSGTRAGLAGSGTDHHDLRLALASSMNYCATYFHSACLSLPRRTPPASPFCFSRLPFRIISPQPPAPLHGVSVDLHTRAPG